VWGIVQEERNAKREWHITLGEMTVAQTRVVTVKRMREVDKL